MNKINDNKWVWQIIINKKIMKSIAKLVAVALLLNNSLAIKQKYLGELELPTLVDENDVAQDKALAE